MIVSKIKIVLADDSLDLLRILKKIIEADDQLEVIKICPNGLDAVESTIELGADVLILDISMPVIDGFQVITQLREQGSQVKIIVLSGHSFEFYGEKALSIGANRYIEKGISVKTIIKDIKDAYHDL